MFYIISQHLPLTWNIGVRQGEQFSSNLSHLLHSSWTRTPQNQCQSNEGQHEQHEKSGAPHRNAGCPTQSLSCKMILSTDLRFRPCKLLRETKPVLRIRQIADVCKGRGPTAAELKRLNYRDISIPKSPSQMFHACFTAGINVTIK